MCWSQRVTHARAGTPLRDCGCRSPMLKLEQWRTAVHGWPTPEQGCAWGTMTCGWTMPEQGHPWRTEACGQPMPGREQTWGTTACGQSRPEQRHKRTGWQETIKCRVAERNYYTQSGQTLLMQKNKTWLCRTPPPPTPPNAILKEFWWRECNPEWTYGK